MIVLDYSPEDSMVDSWSLQLYGLGLVSISFRAATVIFLKGMSDAMLNSLIRAYKKRIIEIREGKIIDLVGSYTLYIHFFDIESEILAIFYLNKKDVFTRYDDLCSFSSKILNMYNLNHSQLNLNSLCKEIVNLPRLSALFIISADGHCLFSKTSSEYLDQNAIQISGFISAILLFSNEVIGKTSGESLKTINFERIQFHVKLKSEIIFAYLIEHSEDSVNIDYFTELIAEDFLNTFSTQLQNFSGRVSAFRAFESHIEKYLIH
jgi:hypothetical protein